MLLADFRIQFPEMRGVSDSTCQVMLDSAFLEIDQQIWGLMLNSGAGSKADQGHAYLAAHKLASSPSGQNAKLVAKDGTTTYWKTYMTLVRQVSAGYRVAQ